VSCNDGNNAPNAEYDTDDPPMVVDSTYSSMAIFRFAISQHRLHPCLFHQGFQIITSSGCYFKLIINTNY
jgi:hypothetical protein